MVLHQYKLPCTYEIFVNQDFEDLFKAKNVASICISLWHNMATKNGLSTYVNQGINLTNYINNETIDWKIKLKLYCSDSCVYQINMFIVYMKCL
jgi:hypothetical protein